MANLTLTTSTLTTSTPTSTLSKGSHITSMAATIMDHLIISISTLAQRSTMAKSAKSITKA